MNKYVHKAGSSHISLSRTPRNGRPIDLRNEDERTALARQMERAREIATALLWFDYDKE